MLSRVLLLLSVVSFLGVSATVDSLAVFADTEANAGNTMSTGTVSITDSPDSAFLTVANMAPGDSEISSLTVDNDGSLQLRYALTSSSTNVDGKGLASQLELAIRVETVNGCAALDGALLYNGTLAAAAFGSVAQGAQAGDRELDAGTSETLCFRVELPIGTGDAYQDAATETTFTLTSEQTANNP